LEGGLTTHHNAPGQIIVAAPVISRDGTQLGTVKEVRGDAFKVDAPMQPDYWLGNQAVQSWDGQQVLLAFDAEHLGDFRVDSPGDGVDTVAAADAAYESGSSQAGDRRAKDQSYAGTARDVDTDDERAVQLREERLMAEKRTVDAGEVGVRKEVIVEEKAIDVPVRREEVYIERRSGSGHVTSEPIGDGETIRIPLREEEVRAVKDTVVTGEVVVGKRTVEETQRVSAPVRREEARVETIGEVNTVQEVEGTQHISGRDHDRSGRG
jgi:uncharacterized protein (TIGR02271 family)